MIIDFESMQEKQTSDVLLDFLKSKFEAGGSKATYYAYASRLTRLRNLLLESGLDFFPETEIPDEELAIWMQEVATKIQETITDRSGLSIVRSFYHAQSTGKYTPFDFMIDTTLSTRTRKRTPISIQQIKEILYGHDWKAPGKLRDLALLFLFLDSEASVGSLVSFTLADMTDDGLKKHGKVIMLHPNVQNLIATFLNNYYSVEVLSNVETSKIDSLPIFPSFNSKGAQQHAPLSKQGGLWILKTLTGTTTPYVDIEEFNTFLDTNPIP
jgi:site-specific recombinase XerD